MIGPAKFSFDILSDGSLVLTLGEACIQTTAKQAHHELTQVLLCGRAVGTAMGAIIEMLAQFLNATDFAKLRAEHPELAGGTKCRVRLYRFEDGSVRWEVIRPT